MKGLVCMLALGLVFSEAHAAQKEQETVAAVLVLEAGGEGRAGMEAVFEVIQNRARGGKTLYEVVTAPAQFSSLNGLSPAAAIVKARKSKAWPLAMQIVTAARRTNHTRGATHFDNVGAFGTPRWAKNAAITAKVGHHTFFKITA